MFSCLWARRLGTSFCSIECLLAFYLRIKLNRYWSLVFVFSFNEWLVCVAELVEFKLSLIVVGFTICIVADWCKDTIFDIIRNVSLFFQTWDCDVVRSLLYNRFLSRAWFTLGRFCRWQPWPKRWTLNVSCDWVMLDWVKSSRSLIICTNSLVDSHYLLTWVIFLISCILALLALIEIVLVS